MDTNNMDLQELSSNCGKTILSLIKEVEDISAFNNMSGLKKKEYVITKLQSVLPDYYIQHKFIIDNMIDTIILVSNKPDLVKASTKPFFYCCGC